MVLVKDIAQMVRNKNAYFDRYFDGKLVYKILNPLDENWYYYDIPIEDTRGWTFFKEDKAVYHVRWIRKAIQTNQFRREYL